MRYAFFCVLVIGRGQRKTEDDPKISSLFRFFKVKGFSLKRATDGWTMDIQRVSKISSSSSSSSSFFHSHTLVQKE